MGLFENMDIASADDDPFGIADGWHPMRVTEMKTQEWKNKKQDNRDETALVIEYEVTDPESDYYERTISDFLAFPFASDSKLWDKDDKQRAARIKQRLAQLEIPEERMNDVEADDIVGTDVNVRVKNNGQYKNVVEVKVDNASDDGMNEFLS